MSQLLKSKLTLAVAVGASVVLVDLLWRLLKKRNSSELPKRWRKVGEISELLCYPIKSCGWIRLDEFDCEIIGVAKNNIKDRSFMVVKDNCEFTTGRAYPKLVQVMPKIEGDLMTLAAPGMTPIQVDFSELSKKKHSKAIVWDESVDVIDAGDAVAEWLSRFILQADSGLRLVYYPSLVPTRDVRQKNKIFETAIRKDTGALHDATSYMLINESSIEDLNTRVEKKVTPLRFRPNFVVKGASEYDEDNWKYVKIGDEVILQNVKPCTRCLFTNIDPETAERDPEEPLKTLKTYRKFDKTGESPVMGIHLGIRRQGKIKLGDSVYVDDQ